MELLLWSIQCWRTQDEELDSVRDILGHPQPKSEKDKNEAA